MVVFAITREGFIELEPIIKTLNYPVWVGAGVLSTNELAGLRSSGLDLTDFSYAIEPTDMEAIQNALETIATHHPEQRVWLEFQPE